MAHFGHGLTSPGVDQPGRRDRNPGCSQVFHCLILQIQDLLLVSAIGDFQYKRRTLRRNQVEILIPLTGQGIQVSLQVI